MGHTGGARVIFFRIQSAVQFKLKLTQTKCDTIRHATHFNARCQKLLHFYCESESFIHFLLIFRTTLKLIYEITNNRDDNVAQVKIVGSISESC